MSPKNTDKVINRSRKPSRFGRVADSTVAAQRLVEFAQSSLGLGGREAYLLCAIAVQAAGYCVPGFTATFAVNRAQTFRTVR
jgi:hypothetical protein